jgi:hypothetical protein
MPHTALARIDAIASPVTPWSLRAWPQLLWQVGLSSTVRFHHLDTRITLAGAGREPVAGQTVWAGHAHDGDAGVAWDWVQIGQGVVAIADPMSVVTNVRLIGEEGEVLTAHAAARYLNELVRSLPWQSEVRRALGARHAPIH